MQKLSEWFFGNPWVYHRLRPFVLGGFDFSQVYGWLETHSEDVIIDVGCGFGAGLEHLSDFREYHGFDTSRRGIASMRERYPDPRVHLYNRTAEAADFERIQPTKAVLMGILHHLSDREAAALLHLLRSSSSLTRAITEDPVYIKGRFLNNLLAWLDRGRYVRSQEHQERLVRSSELTIARTIWCDAGNHWASYMCFGLTVNP